MTDPPLYNKRLCCGNMDQSVMICGENLKSAIIADLEAFLQKMSSPFVHVLRHENKNFGFVHCASLVDSSAFYHKTIGKTYESPWGLLTFRGARYGRTGKDVAYLVSTSKRKREEDVGNSGVTVAVENLAEPQPVEHIYVSETQPVPKAADPDLLKKQKAVHVKSILRVECPVCQKQVGVARLEAHVDGCLIDDAPLTEEEVFALLRMRFEKEALEEKKSTVRNMYALARKLIDEETGGGNDRSE